MGEVYIGRVNVTEQYSRFYFDGDQPRPGRVADGNFSDEEVSLFAGEEEPGRAPRGSNNMSVLTYVRGRLPTESGLVARFQAYESYIRNGCESVVEGTPVAQALYEELTQFIESPLFARATPVMQERIVGLQADLFSRLAQRGTHRGSLASGGSGTAVEDVQFNPISEPFQANQSVLDNVLPVAANLVVLEGEQAAGIEQGQCIHRQVDQTGGDREVNYNVYPLGATEARPFLSGRVTSISRSWLLSSMPEVESHLETLFTVSRSNPDRLIVGRNIEALIAAEVADGNMTREDGDYLLQLLAEPINMDFRYDRHQRAEEEGSSVPAAGNTPTPASRPQAAQPLVVGDDNDPLGGLDDLGD